MCLELEPKAKKLTATKDIKCWIVAVRKETGEIVTLYREAPIRNKMKSVIRRTNDEVDFGLHSFARKKDAVEVCRLVNRTWPDDGHHIVLGCYLPEGCKYYRGTFEFRTVMWGRSRYYCSYAATRRNLVTPLTKR